MQPLLQLIQQHKAGKAVGIYAVCSAHPLVIEAALLQGKKDNALVLIEATSNQVNQDGGYTGMCPEDYITLVHQLADNVGFDRSRLLLGGDHLGPNCWQHLEPNEAMAKSEVLIERYVEAGFRKIHLDCSMSCADDEYPLPDDTVAKRAAQLCRVAEQTWQRVGGEAPVYVIGTEVPVPGGAQEQLSDDLAITDVCAAATTLDTHLTAFTSMGLEPVWPRVVGLVVQPGVEFDHHKVIHYDSDKAQALSQFVEQQPYLVYEAHSTDYQAEKAYQALVHDHFAILKVGPALTFALREALFALDQIEREWIGEHKASHLRATVEQVMQENPDYWRSYYPHVGHQQYFDCKYSFSDRIRYYWSHPAVQQATEILFANLAASPAPLTLLSQYMPMQYKAVCDGDIALTPEQLVIHKIMEVTRIYSGACGHEL
ncbi:D-tagatose-bisphosphate aldolase, class II, non-catalytic subunit [Photobacterium kasasachensis]|uniref:D-tagatose-bisphosphate aldolase, class II, non-catalytic subunit n=1 Tax=Photobacterium kasasachensis TaxID=2910240 RepID=UPI003D132412